jgi:hypothetical protein
LLQPRRRNALTERAGTETSGSSSVMRSIYSNELIHRFSYVRHAHDAASSADRNITLTVGYRQAREEL